MSFALPDGFTVRAPTMDDEEAITDLLNTCSFAEYGTADYTTEEIRADFEWIGFSLETDAWVVVTPDSKIVGYASVWVKAQVHILAEGYVHPEYCSQGIGTYLLDVTEARAPEMVLKAPEGARVTLSNGISGVNHAARHLLESRGYTASRHDWRMEIDLTEAPPAPQWPAGITLRTFVLGQDDRAVHQAREEAFQDHRGYLPLAFEQWYHHMQQRETFDPTLWFLAMDGSQIAGLLIGYAEPDLGWIDQVAVRRPWRRQGLGMALLRHSFGEFYRRGIHKVGLGVDAQSLTGATHLYERAGMHVARQYDRYEKELRPGVELSTQALAE